MPVDHYENFPVASILLPPSLRTPIAAIYHFARSADDLADEGDAPPAERLAALDRYDAALETIAAGARVGEPMFDRLADTIRTHRLPITLFHDLISAFRQDVTVTRYPDRDTLLDYCRRSANPVGRLVLHLTGHTRAHQLAQSDAICSALQLINFWQDVAIDWQKNRVYLPQTDLAAHGVGEAQIAAQRCDDAWQALLRDEIDFARQLMHSGAPLVHTLPGRLGWEIRLTVQGGLRILERIERVDGDVFRHRPVLGAADWGIMLLRAIFR